MAEDVKRAPRRYDNSNRKAQARQTQRRVVEAARRLFVRDGYATTTIQALADEAGVAEQTVYAAFGSKIEVLKRLFGTSIVGDDEAAPLIERPDWQAWETKHDIDRLVDAFVVANRKICERAADVARVVAAAAASHPEIAEMWEQAEAARYQDQRRFTDRLSDSDLLRTSLSRQHAADIVWTLAGPGPYTDLVQRRGWSNTAYESWLSEQLTSALLQRGKTNQD
jgi:AcrR family transcriptional regulator